MLKEAKLALRVTAEAYDAEIAGLLEAGALDLGIAGVVLPGTVAFAVNASTGVVTDNSTLTDPLCQRALFTYARMNFGSPDDYERLRDSYEIQKCLLMHAAEYTDYEGGEGA